MGVVVDQFLESSIMEENLATRWVFLWLCQLSDARGRVDMTRNVLARRIGVNRRQLDVALERLMAPDPESRSREHDGRRILPLDDQRTWGWQVVNARVYLTRAQRQNRRARDREYQRQKRERQRQSQREPQRPRQVQDRRSEGSEKRRPTNADACRRLPTAADPPPPLHSPSSGGGVDKSTPRRLSSAQLDLKSISEVFERFGAAPLQGPQHGAWARRLKLYRDSHRRRSPNAEESAVRQEGLAALLRDLETCGRAGYLADRGKSYVLKIIDGVIEGSRCGRFRVGTSRRRWEEPVSEATLERAALLDEEP